MGGSEENVEKRTVNLKKFFKLKELLESKILRYRYIQNTSCITTKERNAQTYSDIEIIQKSRPDNDCIYGLYAN
jgi:hypothetical protein